MKELGQCLVCQQEVQKSQDGKTSRCRNCGTEYDLTEKEEEKKVE